MLLEIPIIWSFLIIATYFMGTMMTSHVLFVHRAVSRLQVPEMDVLVLKAMQDLGVHPNLLAVSLGPLGWLHTAFLKDVLVLLARIPAFHFSWKIAF